MKSLKLTNFSPIFKRIGSLIAAISGLAGILTVLLVYYPPDHQNAKLVGRWESDYSYPITGGTASFQGKTDLFQQGKYNVIGVMTLEGVVEDKPYKFIYNVVGAGGLDWRQRADVGLSDQYEIHDQIADPRWCQHPPGACCEAVGSTFANPQRLVPRGHV